MPKHRRQSRTNRKTLPLAPSFVGRVRDMANDGRAVVTDEQGRVYLVSGAWLDEVVKVQPTIHKTSVSFGRAVAVIKASAFRREPACRHQGDTDQHCGGCPWMFIDYEEQLRAKQRRVLAQLEKMAVAPSVLKPIMASTQQWAYRNRAQFKTNGLALGYVASGSHALIDVEHCAVLSDASNAQLTALRATLPNVDWRGGRTQLWRSIDIDDQLDSPSLDARLPFRQGNTQQNTVMRQWLAGKIAQMDSASPVLELFCGAGNFTAVLAEHFAQVHGVEGDEAAVETLKKLQFASVSTEAQNLFDPLVVDELARRQAGTQILVLDPPRDGLKVRLPLLKRLRKLHTVVYVSCDLATWARDCADFTTHGLTLCEVQPLDLFPQTPHVEILSVLRRF